MGKIGVILGLGLLGFVIGFAGFLAFGVLGDTLVRLIPYLFSLDGFFLRAMFSGLIGSVITVIAVVIWSYSSKQKY